MFTTTLDEIIEQVALISPFSYGKTRNYLDGDVTRLSPYISRGVISTRYVLDTLVQKGISPLKVERLTQELCWRDYWQQVWLAKGDSIDTDLKKEQEEVEHWEMPTAIIEANTGIEVIDQGIEDFYRTGYLHNHLRMYIAAITCNQGKSHWKIPAQWMYYHLLDGDWASNALSWQWVAGSNSNKKYIANQDNINKHSKHQQKGTFLDVSYEQLATLTTPDILKATMIPNLQTPLPEVSPIKVSSSQPILIYNWYNIDPFWEKDLDANRILLLEPSHFDKYPISQQSMDFLLGLSENIEGIQVFVGEFDALMSAYPDCEIHYKEHPTNNHYKGIQHPRDWISSVEGYYPSFFGFWKKVKKELKSRYRGMY
ncbi:FAD-binding domain-containing protein [Algivirga pacifica]|uniref:Cryptochrome/DNA photolyase FAD-binding domain-containing protein n=1 Tax=Algivirga pacifica TaxID=1162670 RepID=A0ABP9D3Q1_9BACT